MWFTISSMGKSVARHEWSHYKAHRVVELGGKPPRIIKFSLLPEQEINAQCYSISELELTVASLHTRLNQMD